MEIYLTEEIFNSLLNSLAKELHNYYTKSLPVLIGVGISGIEIVGRLPDILGAPNLETYVCDVSRRKDSIDKVIDFPSEKVKGRRVLIAYVRVDTGRTLETLTKLAIEAGAIDVKTLSIAARKGTSFFPNFFCFIVNDDDNMYILLEGYPPDLTLPYPPVIVSPGAFVRELSHKDAYGEWFKCGDERIDKFGPGEYLYYKELNKRCRVFVLDDGRRLLGLLHFYVRRRNVWVETLAICKDAQNKGLGSKLVTFLIDWSKFNNVSHIYLDAFREREGFYEGLGFERIKRFEIPSYARFCRMRRKVL